MNRRTAILPVAGLLAASLVILAACSGGGRQRAPTAGASPTPSFVPGALPATSPSADATSGRSFIPCPGSGPRNDQHPELSFALSDPICVGLGGPPGSGATVTAELVGVESTTQLLSPGGASFVLLSNLSPYGAAGCSQDGTRVLTVTVRAAGGEPLLTAGLHCSAGTDPAQCRDLQFGPVHQVAMLPSGATCIGWQARSPERQAFRVEVTYPTIGAVYAYLLPATEIRLLLPEEASPRLDESPARCRARKSFAIAIFELSPGREALLDSTITEAECRIG